MRIIKQGKNLKEVEVTCNTCEAIYAVMEDDVSWLRGDYDGEVNCPCCGKTQYLESVQFESN